MTATRIISALVLLAVLGGFAAVYQFYFKEKLEAYSRDEDQKRALEQTYADLSSFFQGYKPDVVTAEWNRVRPSWQSAVTERARYYNDGGWYRHDVPAENVPILRFWYDEKSKDMVGRTWNRLASTMGPNFPPDFHAVFGVPRAEEWLGMTVSRQEVNRALGKLSFGISVLDLLAEARASRIEQVSIWPTETKPKHNDLLVSRTVGLDFYMTAENLVRFLERLRHEDRYFSVDALRIEYPFILANTEPNLRVKMLLTQAVFKPRGGQATGEEGEGQDDGGSGVLFAGFQPQSAQQLFQAEGFGRTTFTPPPEPNIFQKGWKWFKRYILYTN